MKFPEEYYVDSVLMLDLSTQARYPSAVFINDKG